MSRNKVYRVYYLYRDGQLIYIGCTCNLKWRLQAHKYTARAYDSYRTVRFTSRAEAFAFEARQIKKHTPEQNLSSLFYLLQKMAASINYVI